MNRLPPWKERNVKSQLVVGGDFISEFRRGVICSRFTNLSREESKGDPLVSGLCICL